MNRIEINLCPICGAEACSLNLGISYGIKCFDERVKIDFSCCLNNNCRFVFQCNPLSRSDTITYYKSSPRYRSPEQSTVDFRLYDSQLEFMVSAGFERQASVLDIGADMGKLLDVAKERYGAVTAYMEDNEYACSYLNTHQRHRHITELQMEDSFDWIVFSQVLEHIVDPVPFLTKLQTNLKPQGRVFIEVPCHSFWDSKDYEFSFEHVNYFSPLNLSLTLHRAGFIVTRLSVCSDDKYFQGNIRIIRAIAQILGNSAISLPEVVRSHHQLGMIKKFQKLRELFLHCGKDDKLSLYGAGELTELILSDATLDKTRIVAIFDTDSKKHGTFFHGLPIHPPGDIPVIAPHMIIILSAAESTISEKINATGYNGVILKWSQLTGD